MTHYTATYQPAHNRWELRTPGSLVAVAYNADLHPMDTDGAREWVTRAVTDFDTAPDYVGATGLATPTVHASTSTAGEASADHEAERYRQGEDFAP